MFRFSLFFLFIFSFQALAAGGLTKQKITSVAFQTGGFYMTSHGNSWGNPNNCQVTDTIVLLAADSNYDKAYPLLLAAYMSGKSVQGYSNKCYTHDGRTYNTIRGYKYLVISE